ncbi:PadR family transcriptional regulator [Sporichthya sp.]|uniref:PadR family transcriptional regulator n=1 Tax=Sporichthya sp. TaxID=65475 RepID=UPI0017B4BAE2|nr:helix-turn-helix transcriptional regulator [Sporichthya sp.]MBA3742226.1 PadR family transcriptional regulator [Sporichthya sp.]
MGHAVRMELQVHARVVLGVLCVEGPAHGFALARKLSPEAELGRAWSVSRPQVYRAIEQLAEAGFARAGEVESGSRGPGRTPFQITAAGTRTAREWFDQPVDHLRDARSELLIKLMLRDRMGLPRSPFIDQQYQVFVDLTDALVKRSDADPADLVAMWRAEMARGVLAAIGRLRSG